MEAMPHTGAEVPERPPGDAPPETPRVRSDASGDWLKFADICAAAQADADTRTACLRLLCGHGVVAQRLGQQWIPFADSWFLCQRLGLDPALLLSCRLRAPEEPPSRGGNYLFLDVPLPPEYSILWRNETAIPYLPGAQTVHATRLMQAMGLRGSAVPGWLAKRTTARTHVRGNHTVHGLYVGLGDALQLCLDKRLDVHPVQVIAHECGVVLDVSSAAAR